MNYMMDYPHKNRGEVHWKLMMAARENSKRYDLCLERGYLRYFGWSMRTAKMRYVVKRHKPRFWNNQQRKEN